MAHWREMAYEQQGSGSGMSMRRDEAMGYRTLIRISRSVSA